MVNPIYASIILDPCSPSTIFPGENIKHHGDPRYLPERSGGLRGYLSTIWDKMLNIERL